MEIETWQAINEGLSRSLLQMIEVIVLINVICVGAGFIIYLAGIAWLCFKETRRPAPRQIKPASRSRSTAVAGHISVAHFSVAKE